MNQGLSHFSDTRALVVGDVMLDRYHRGSSTRISPEAPVPVVKVGGVEEHAGGAANVAVNLATLGATVHLLSVTGADANGRALKNILDVAGVRHRLLEVAGARTIVKSRVVSHGQQLLRFDVEGDFGASFVDELGAAFRELVADVDAVIFSDYAKGCLVGVEKLIAAAREAGKLTFVDPKGVDFQRYRGATVLTPNYGEFVAVAGACGMDELAQRAEALRAELDLGAVVVTLGERGMLLVEAGCEAQSFASEAHEIYDVTGAGDTAVAVLSMARASGMSLPDAVRYANCAAGIAVEKSGTATIAQGELLARMRGGGAVCDKPALLDEVAKARARGERIVMTNGCFDLLHAGHIAYLERAAQQGERLIVAVNDDASVARLKGDGRPLNALADRMRVLGALRMVDWVMAFSEDTPADLIAEVSPNVLVKGGDYRVEDIAGAPHVQANGGEVLVLDYIDGRSTSELIKRIRGV